MSVFEHTKVRESGNVGGTKGEVGSDSDETAEEADSMASRSSHSGAAAQSGTEGHVRGGRGKHWRNELAQSPQVKWSCTYEGTVDPRWEEVHEFAMAGADNQALVITVVDEQKRKEQQRNHRRSSRTGKSSATPSSATKRSSVSSMFFGASEDPPAQSSASDGPADDPAPAQPLASAAEHGSTTWGGAKLHEPARGSPSPDELSVLSVVAPWLQDQHAVPAFGHLVIPLEQLLNMEVSGTSCYMTCRVLSTVSPDPPRNPVRLISLSLLSGAGYCFTTEWWPGGDRTDVTVESSRRHKYCGRDA
jgi:hypothetical protein